MTCPTERNADFSTGKLSIFPKMDRLLTFLLTAEIFIFTGDFDILPVVNKDIQKTLGMYLEYKKKHSIRSLNPHVDIYVDSLQINFRQRQYEPLSVGHRRKEFDDYGKMMNTETQGHTFTKKIGQTVYVVRYHFNEDAKETMQEKINRMLVTEASRMEV